MRRSGSSTNALLQKVSSQLKGERVKKADDEDDALNVSTSTCICQTVMRPYKRSNIPGKTHKGYSLSHKHNINLFLLNQVR